MTSIKTTLKGKGMIGFVGRFRVNLRIPEYIGLGKSVSRGFGTPFDYKFARAPKKTYHNQRVQSVLYGLLIREVFDKPVHRGFICYVRSKHRVVELQFSERDFALAQQTVREVVEIIQQGYLPPATRYRSRCTDCCYRNICMQ